MAVGTETYEVVRTYNGVRWIVDPLNKYAQKTSAERLIEGLGFIPEFITEETDDVVEEALSRYGFNLGGPMGGDVSSDGVYKYPGDPDLYPYAVALLPNKKMRVFVYAYGIITFLEDSGKHTTYRFD